MLYGTNCVFSSFLSCNIFRFIFGSVFDKIVESFPWNP